MIAQFFRNALLLVALNLLVKGIYLFGVERTVQNVLPEGDYGLYFSLLSAAMLVQVVADFGLQLYSARTIAGHRHLLEKYFPYFIGLKLVLGLAFYAILFLGAGLLGYESGARYLLALAATALLGNSLVLYLRSNLSGLGWYRLDSFFSILDKLLMIAGVGGLLWLAPDRLTIELFAGLQLSAWVITAATLLLVLGKKLPRKLPRFRLPLFLLLLRGGAPFALAVFLMTAYTRLDAVMIERLLADGAVAADHYAAGYRLLDALNMAGWLVAGLLLPMFARQHSLKEPLVPLLRFSVELLVTIGLLVAIPLAWFAEPVAYLLYDFAEPRTAHVLRFLALTFVAQCFIYAYGSLLNAAGLIGRMNKWFGLAIGLNIAGNFWVLPRYGAAGAAAVTLVTQSVIAGLETLLAHRWLDISGGAIRWGRLVLLATGLATGGWILTAPGPGFPWLISAVGLGLAGVGAAFGLKLLDWKEMAGLLRNR